MKEKIKSIKDKVKNVDLIGLVEGVTNKFTGDMEEIAKQRSVICIACPSIEDEPIAEIAIKDTKIKGISKKICGECSCALPYKVRQNNSNCPLNKW